MAILNDLADAVATVLTDAMLSLGFTAVRAYVPEKTLTELAALHVTVVPSGRQSEITSRKAAELTFSIDVAVQQRSTEKDPDDDPDTYDALMTLVEEIEETLLGFELTVNSYKLVCTNVDRADAFNFEHMHEHRQFTGVAQFSYKMVQ